MLALLLSAAALAEITVSLESPLVMQMEMEMPTDLSAQLNGMLAQLERMQMPRPVRVPANPCEQDQRRLRCNDAACLRRAADGLAPACAAFLLGEPEPSPAPLLGGRGRGAPSGFFSVISSNSNGEVRRASGPLMGGMAMLPEAAAMRELMMPPSLAAVLPPEIRALLGDVALLGDAGVRGSTMREAMMGMGGGMLQQQNQEEDEDEEQEEVAQHPCAAEINACVRVTGARDHDTIKECLHEHLSMLSSHCKCFVQQHHSFVQQGTDSRSQAPAHATPLSTRSAPAVVVVDAAAPFAPPPIHPLHRLSCLLFFTALFLLTIMLTRALLNTLCAPRAATRHVVMVPPESAMISTTPPKPSSKPGRAPQQPVQVAEPL